MAGVDLRPLLNTRGRENTDTAADGRGAAMTVHGAWGKDDAGADRGLAIAVGVVVHSS